MNFQSDEVHWLGIDAGEQNHYLVLLDRDGKPTKKSSCPNRTEKIRELLTRWRHSRPNGRIRVVMESKRGVGAVIYRTALRLGLDIWRVPPVSLASFRRSEGQPRKSDPHDAELLARMGFLSSKSCRPQVQSQPEETALCCLSRLSERLSRQETQLWHQLRSRLLELHPALVDRQSKTPRYRSTRMLQILVAFPGLEGIDTAPVEQLEAFMSAVPVAQRGVEAQRLQEVAASFDLPQEQRSVLNLELGILTRQLVLLRQEVEQIEKRLKQAVDAHPLGRRLLAAPGVGVKTAAVLIGELLPVARHATEAQVASYCGLAPIPHRSGRSQGRDRIGRGANKHIKRALYLSATSARRFSSLDAAYYRKQYDRHTGHPVPHIVATVALARQRLKMLYKLLTTDAEYDKEILIRSHLERLREVA